ncbi:hypothetical protein [Thiorhodovibrio winogradskyi]|uniref:hypothetical protein n=1 Tax=Thiorhodovibrio winogradskyi TaxID=77007 RepID=UPI002E2C85AF|nr:hypothetical protein [Thiorhodovibrio winogradskyi]
MDEIPRPLVHSNQNRRRHKYLLARGLEADQPITIEKLIALFSSSDTAISFYLGAEIRAAAG